MNRLLTTIVSFLFFASLVCANDHAGKIMSCVADKSTVKISGSINERLLPEAQSIEIRLCQPWQHEFCVDSLELLSSIAPEHVFSIDNIPNIRLSGKMTHLSSRFIAVLKMKNGGYQAIDAPFFIENWRDFYDNPYEFETNNAKFFVKKFGAKGDGTTNDNQAIQNAIDAASKHGGGKVILDGNGTFIATNLELRRGVELVIERGSELRQSGVFEHYEEYPPELGHDNVIPGVPWTHCMYSNRPLILAKDTDHVKITGGGTIRMDDTSVDGTRRIDYPRNCANRIHLLPIAVCNTSHVEISDINIVRCSNYHTLFYRADSIFIGNLKMLDVACLSGDGLSFGNAVTNVKVARCVFQSNDDGVVLCSSYKDPRGFGWRERVDTIDSSVRHIEVVGSYIDSNYGGGGKAIAIIPWGSTNPRQDYNEIDDISVSDCVLRGGNSVGTWSDNPFDGKPFTNTEPDDYAPVKNLRIYNNEYLSPRVLNGVVPTTLLTDCGLKGSSTFKNADFVDRTAYWTFEGIVEAEPGKIHLRNGKIYQGLYLEPGAYTITWTGDGDITPFADKVDIDPKGHFAITEAATVIVGVKGRDINLTSINLK